MPRPMSRLPAPTSLTFATLRPGTGVDLRERINLLRGERRLVPVAFVAITVAASVALPLALLGRADPRRTQEAIGSAAILDPIEATLALQAIDPPVDLHEVAVTDISSDAEGRSLLRWRTAALDG